MNYVLIDYENVQPTDLPTLDQEHFKIMLFIGQNQTRIGLDLALVLQPMGSRVEYIRISGNGSNALDFHIAYYIGKIAAVEPTAYFHIISKDSGFDPLIQRLKCNKLFVCRSQDISDIPFIRASRVATVEEGITVIIDDLQKRKEARPRSIKTLSSTINALFRKQLTEDHLSLILQELQKRGYLKFDGNKVLYTSP